MDGPGFLFVLREAGDERKHKILPLATDPRLEVFARHVLVVRRFGERLRALESMLQRLEERGIVPVENLTFECAPHELVHEVVDAPEAAQADGTEPLGEPRVRLDELLGLSTVEAEQVIVTEFRESISPRNLAAYVAASSSSAATPDERLLEAIERDLRLIAPDAVSEERIDELFDRGDVSEERLLDEVLARPGYGHVPRVQLGLLMRAALKIAVLKGTLATNPSLLQRFIANVASHLEGQRALHHGELLETDQESTTNEGDQGDDDDEPEHSATTGAKEIRALIELAEDSYYGRGDEIQDFDRARLLFEEAAERGSVQAMRMIGTMLRDGEGGKQNLQRAAKQYRTAADAGDMESWAELGKLFGEPDPEFGLDQPDNARKCWDRYFAAEAGGAVEGSLQHFKDYIIQAHRHEWPRQHRRMVQENEAKVRRWYELLLASIAERPHSETFVHRERQQLMEAIEWYLESPAGLLATSLSELAPEPAHRFSLLAPAARERIFRSLCRLMHCDGQVDTRERVQLEMLREDLGVSNAAAARLESEANIGSLRIGTGTEERNALVDCMVEMTLADGHIDPRERSLLMKVASAVGLEPARLEEKLRQHQRRC